jgi:O-antigen/teichoic acid export membrane protein
VLPEQSAPDASLNRRQYLRHFLIVLSGNGAAQAINLLGYPILAHVYAPHEFGAFGLFVAASAVPGALASARLEYALPTAPLSGASGVMWLAVISSGIMGLLSFCVAAIVWGAGIEAALLGLCVLLTGLCASYSAFLLRHERYRAVSASVVLRTVAAMLAQVGLALVVAANAINLIGGYAFGLVAQTTLFVVLAVRWARPDRPRWSTMRAMALRYRNQISVDVPNAFVASIFFNMFTFVLAALYDQRTVGYYTIGYRLAVVPFTVFNDALGQVFFQKASRAKENRGHSWHELRFGFAIAGMISCSVLIAILLFARPMIVLVLGARWAPAADMLVVLAPMIAIRGAVLSISPTAFILQRTPWLFAYSVVAILLTIVSVGAALIAHLSPTAFLAVASTLLALEAAILGAALVYAARQDRLASASMP